jgi:hypothetical protein
LIALVTVSLMLAGEGTQSSSGWTIANNIFCAVAAALCVVVIPRWMHSAENIFAERPVPRFRPFRSAVESDPLRRLVEETGAFVLNPFVFAMIFSINSPWRGFVFLPIAAATILVAWKKSDHAIRVLAAADSERSS